MRFLAALVLAAPLFAQCTYTIDKPQISLPATATAATVVNITASPSQCRWLANVDTGSAYFLKLTDASKQVMTGSGSITFSTDANPFGQIRRGTITIQTESTLNQTIIVNQDAAVCAFNFNPSAQSFSVVGGSGAVIVTANCAWSVSSNVGQWINIPGASSTGTTNTTVPFTVAGNPCVSARFGTIFMNGSGLAKSLTSSITQDGSPSNFSLSATTATADATANDYRFGVTTGTGCGWSASSDVTWMQLTQGSSGSGNGNVAYHLIANTSSARTGSIHVNSGGVQFLYTVTQSAPGSPTPSIASVANAANYTSDAISPGEIITIFGQNLGPASIVPLQVSNGLLTTTLGGTQVLFDNVPAPMIYSFKSQISAIAPYGLAGKSTTQVQVSYNGVVSEAVTVPVQDSTPAIFTVDSSGLGPGAILNQDLNLNTSARPADRGSVVAIYCTGGGAVDPAVTDGSIVGATLPRVKLPVSVTIGGVNAKVSYSGGVPSSIAGLVQINAEIPPSLPANPKTPIVVKIGDAISTTGVTIAVR